MKRSCIIYFEVHKVIPDFELLKAFSCANVNFYLESFLLSRDSKNYIWKWLFLHVAFFNVILKNKLHTSEKSISAMHQKWRNIKMCSGMKGKYYQRLKQKQLQAYLYGTDYSMSPHEYFIWRFKFNIEQNVIFCSFYLFILYKNVFEMLCNTACE